MATFTNQATLTYSGGTTSSNITTGELLEVHADEQTVNERVQGLSTQYAKETEVSAAAQGDVVFCTADPARYPDGRTVILYTALALPGAEDAVKTVIGKTAGEAFAAELAGERVQLQVQKIVRLIPAEVNDALSASLGIEGVTTVEAYRGYVREKLLADLRVERSKEIMRVYFDAIEAESEFSYDEAEFDAYVDSCKGEFLAQAAEMGIEQTEEELRESLLRQEKQFWAAMAFCKQKGMEIDKAEVEAQVDQMSEMMGLMGEQVPPREEMLRMAEQDAYLNKMFEYINGIIAQKMGG